MEKTQKGEQFRIVDPATRPISPISPNRPLILMIGLFVGLGGGCGAALLLDILNPSFRKNDELEGFSNMPVLAVLPNFPTRGSILDQRRLRVALMGVSTCTLALGIVFIRLFGPSLTIR
jgi:hypothetical protein